MRRLAAAVFLASLAALAVLALALLTQGGGADGGPRILLLSPADAVDGQIAETVNQLEASGFVVTQDREDALSRAASPETVSFLVTRGAFESVPESEWRALYNRQVIVGGIDISLHELQPLVKSGSSAGDARLHYTPDRPIFSFMYATEACGYGAMSDWLESWDLAAVLRARAAQIAESPSTVSPGAGCPQLRP